MFDYLYYRDRYGGELSAQEFEKYRTSAEDIIAALTSRREGEYDGCVLRAMALQADHLAKYAAGERRTAAQSLGDHSVKYELREGTSRYVGGVPVSPEAMLLLELAGYLTRWA